MSGSSDRVSLKQQFLRPECGRSLMEDARIKAKSDTGVTRILFVHEHEERAGRRQSLTAMIRIFHDITYQHISRMRGHQLGKA